MNRRLVPILAAAASALAVGALGAVASPADAAPAAPAAPPGSLSVTYDVTGSTTVARSDLKVSFRPTQIMNTLLSDGSLRSTLPLAPVKVSYLAYGFLPSTATVVFTQVRPATGALTPVNGRLQVSATAQYVVSLRNVAFGGADAQVGPNCQTTRPVTVTVATPPGESFDITHGGTLAGTYSIGQFQNCGNATHLLDDLVPGPDNTLTLALTHGQIGNATGTSAT